MIEILKTPIFTHEVFSFSLPNFETYKKQIEQIVLVEENKSIHKIDTSPENECNVKAKRTAWNSHQKYFALQRICDDVSNYVEQFVASEDYDAPKFETQECWINWYGKGQNALPHHHGSNLSAVLFVDVENTDANFYFHADKNLVLHKKTDVHTNFNDIVEVKAKNGTVLFFDGSISHSVSPNLTEKRRVTMAINFKPVYTYERSEY
mgnify:FL=1|jgi:uncharacterized protein (TIGR02466 family)|tara:strand:- start:124 stop:744 length:621 start_codon:yes stop_codon:yes gene_type:complete